ncbi:MAG: PQQ-binding-like beta-propeller repeat protein, partial [Pyrinomonadaceae bacterium]
MPFLKGFAPSSLILPLSLFLCSCGGKLVKETVAETKIDHSTIRTPTSIPTWLGNPARNFYGTGPWSNRPLQIMWEFKTESSSGRFHKISWAGAGWPGQPAIVEDRVYFGSNDAQVYCLNSNNGNVIWSYKTGDAAKSSAAVARDR